jgi:RNA polymerase primary sigma factor
MAQRMRQLKIEDRLTNRTRAVELYLNEVSREKLFTTDEECEVARKAAQGDAAAINSLAKANLRFVVSVAKQYASGDPILLEELIAQGNIGLLDAAKTFDHTRGFKFISYAVWHIRKEILQYLNLNSRVVRLPSNFNLDRNRIRNAEARLQAKLDRPPSKEELIDELKRQGYKMTDDRFDFVTSTGSTRVALEKQKGDDYDPAPIDWLNIDSDPSELSERGEMKKIIDSLLKHLEPIEADIVIKRMGIPNGDPETLQSIANKYKCSSERIRQIFSKAMKKMKKQASSIGVSEFLD